MHARLPREDELAFAQQMHGTKKRWFTALLANGLLLVSLVGVPYARGIFRAQDTLHGYAQVLSCLLGGKPAAEPGLRHVPALEAYFAQQLLSAATPDGAWLTRCDRALAQLVPAPAIFVWPTTKDAEVRSREAAAVLRRELAALKTHRAPMRVPTNPIRALVQLHEVLQEHVAQAGFLEVPPQAAVILAHSPKALSYATRIPLYAGADAVLTLWGSDASLSVVAVDRTGVSYLNAEAGRYLQSVRHPRPKLLEGFVRQHDQGFLLWALAREKCRAREGGCEAKAMGISHVALPLTQLVAPRWLASHPTGRLDRSVKAANSAQDFWLVAAESAKATEALRGFWLPENPGGELDSALPPLRWTHSTTSSRHHLAFLQRGSETSQIATQVESDQVTFMHVAVGQGSDPRTPEAIARLRTHGAAWAGSCAESDSNETSFALGNESELVMGSISAHGIRLTKPETLALGPVLHARDPSRDRVQLLCTSGISWTLTRTLDDRLFVFLCEPGASECRKQLIAEQVASYAALDTGRSMLVAFAGLGDAAQVQLQRFAYSGKPQGTPQRPSPCWAPRGGLCEQPYLHKLGARILLSAREHTDLLALESDDDGLSWHGLGEFQSSL